MGILRNLINGYFAIHGLSNEIKMENVTFQHAIKRNITDGTPVLYYDSWSKHDMYNGRPVLVKRDAKNEIYYEDLYTGKILVNVCDEQFDFEYHKRLAEAKANGWKHFPVEVKLRDSKGGESREIDVSNGKAYKLYCMVSTYGDDWKSVEYYFGVSYTDDIRSGFWKSCESHEIDFTRYRELGGKDFGVNDNSWDRYQALKMYIQYQKNSYSLSELLQDKKNFKLSEDGRLVFIDAETKMFWHEIEPKYAYEERMKRNARNKRNKR